MSRESRRAPIFRIGRSFLLRHLRPHVGLLAAGTFLASLALACELALPWFTAAIIDDALSAKDRELLAYYTLLLAVAAAALVVFWTLQNVTFSRIGGKVLLDIHRDLLGKAQNLPLQSHYEARVGDVATLFTGDAVACSEFYENGLSSAIESVLQVAATVFVLFAFFPEMASYLILAVPTYVLLTAPLGKPVRKASQVFRQDIATIGGLIQESLSAIREIQAFNRQGWNQQRLKRPFLQALSSRVRLRALREAFNVNVIAFWIVVGAVYWFGGLKVMSGEMTLGKLVAVLSYCRILQQPFIRLVGLYSEIQAALGAADRIAGYLSMQVRERPQPRRRRLLPGPGEVTFEGLSFSYDPGKPALLDVSATVPAGHRLAIVGPSGSGKSTLLRLLLGLYEPDQGRILIDGQEIQGLDKESLREGMAAVFEETVLFSTTVRENIRFGRLEASDQEVMRAARIANAHPFIDSLPQGYDTQVGERGLKLSHGQKQRIAIARAVLRNPRILLLDEATSALDSEAERLVCQGVEELMKNRTTLIVSHRLWTVLSADTIVVLEQGRLIDSGTHEGLLQRCTLYRSLLSTQKVLH